MPAINEPAGPLVPARSFDAIDNVPNWKDLNPRFGIAWDPFGDGKTAVKGGINRYVLSNTTGIANFFDPANASVNSTTRSWADNNGNFLPDCNLKLTAANGECGAMANANFGGLVVTNTPDPAWVTGWGKRPYMWQSGISVDREVTSKVQMSLGYYHTTYGNFYVLDNTLVAPTDYSPYCVTAPTDPRLGSVSGQQLCGLYDLNPNKFGQNRSIVTNVSNYGKQTEIYDGVDLSVNARLQKLTVTGGWNIGTAVQTGTTAGGTAGSRQNNCFVVDSPQQLFNCDIKVPFQNRVKFAASYLLPYDVQLAGVFQTNPGATYNANVTYTNAQVQPSLGRPLAGGAATVTVNVVTPFSQYGDRVNQFDLRAGKIFRIGSKTGSGEHRSVQCAQLQLRGELQQHLRDVRLGDRREHLPSADASARRAPGEIQLPVRLLRRDHAKASSRLDSRWFGGRVPRPGSAPRCAGGKGARPR